MQIKHILIVFIAGFVLVVVGASLKMIHYQGASQVLILGIGLQGLGGLMSIYRLIKTKSFKSFLEK